MYVDETGINTTSTYRTDNACFFYKSFRYMINIVTTVLISIVTERLAMHIFIFACFSWTVALNIR